MAKKLDVYMPLMVGDKFNEQDWFTPNTYNENFKPIPHRPGVYLFVTLDDEVLYVGSAKDLFNRYDKHEVKRILKRLHRWVYFYFREFENYREAEIDIIKRYKPLFNVRHNG